MSKNLLNNIIAYYNYTIIPSNIFQSSYSNGSTFGHQNMPSTCHPGRTSSTVRPKP